MDNPAQATAPDAYRSVWTYLHNVAFRQDWIDVGGIKTRYMRAGPAGAPVVIMLHGTAGSWECFCANIGAHAEHFDCIALDMIGSGFTDKPPYDYEIPQYVEHLYGFMKALGVAKASFIGVSLGSWVAAKFALDNPDMADKITLIAPAGLQSSPESMAQIRGMRTKAVDDPTWENIAPIFGNLIYAEADRLPDFIAVRQQSYSRPDMKEGMRHILCLQEAEARGRNLIPAADWASLETPVLIIAAPDDKAVFYETALALGEIIPRARLETIHQVKHWANFERAEWFNEISLAFLKN